MGLEFTCPISIDEKRIWKIQKLNESANTSKQIVGDFLQIVRSLPVAEIHASRRFFALLDVASCAKLVNTSSMTL